MTATASEPRAYEIAYEVAPEEYEELPANSRLELVDGVVRAMTPPSRRHQEITDSLKWILKSLCPADLRVVREQEVRLSEDHRRNPDLMLVWTTADDLDTYGYEPKDVLLAIEVVSNSTRTADRRHKPGEYADAGIPHYWRVEPLPELVLHTYQLGETGIYLETGLFSVGDTMAVAGLQWASISVADLVP